MQIFPLPFDLEYCSRWDWDRMQFELHHMTFLDQPPAKTWHEGRGCDKCTRCIAASKKVFLNPSAGVIHWASLRSVRPTRRISWMAEQTLHKCPHKGLRMALDAQNEQSFVHATFDKAPMTNVMQMQVNLMMREFIHKASRTECFRSSCLRLQL